MKARTRSLNSVGDLGGLSSRDSKRRFADWTISLLVLRSLIRFLGTVFALTDGIRHEERSIRSVACPFGESIRLPESYSEGHDLRQWTEVIERPAVSVSHIQRHEHRSPNAPLWEEIQRGPPELSKLPHIGAFVLQRISGHHSPTGARHRIPNP
jgi:hypothetical protein